MGGKHWEKTVKKKQWERIVRNKTKGKNREKHRGKTKRCDARLTKKIQVN